MKTNKSDLTSAYAQAIGVEAARELVTQKINASALEDKESFTETEIARICGELTKEDGLIRIIAQAFLIQLEHKKSEEQTLLLDNIETQIWHLTDMETYGTTNRAHAEFMGMEKKYLEGKNIYDIASREEAEVCIAGNRKAFEKKEQIHTEEWIRNGKGETRLLSIIRTPRLDNNRNVEYVICAAEDITERKRAKEALKQRNLELTELNAIVATITATLDLDQVLQRIVASMTKLFPHASGTTIQLLDEATDHLITRAASQDLPARPRQLAFAPGEGIAGLAVRERRPINVADVTTDPYFVPGPTEPPFRSLLVAPLLFGEHSLGTLSMEGTLPMAFGDEDERLVESLAGYAAIAVENAHLFEESQRRSRELALLYDTALATSSVLETERLLQRIYEQVRQLIAPDTFVVALYDADVGEVEFALVMEEGEAVPGAIDLRVPLEEGGLTGWVMRTRQPLLVGDLQVDRLPVGPRHVTRPARSWLGVPLIVHDRLIGVLSVQSFRPHVFDDAHRRLLESLASQVAIALENARMFAQEESRAAELARALQQQQDLDRLKSELIRNVSHELRTPLAIARGYAELLDSGELGELQSIQREPVTIIVRRTHELNKMLDAMSAIMDAEMQELKREPSSLVTLVRELLVSLQIAVEQAELTLAIQIAPNLPMVFGDPAYLHQVVDSLLSNALKFTSTGGRVTVRLEQDNENLVLEVTDTGIGIPADQLERIFERFYQVNGSTTRRYGGAGLGLALVKEIVEAHGGKVSVESQVGQGSTFTVTLPIYDK